MKEIYHLVIRSLIIWTIPKTTRVKHDKTSWARENECGDFFPNHCQESMYRTYDGSCNNQLHPTWGMPFTRNGRLLPANYADGIHAPRVSKSGRPLPLARTLSINLDPNFDILDKKYTLATMQFGQLIAHDMSLVDEPIETSETQCCTPDGKLLEDYIKKPLCYPLIIPDNDPDYKKSGIKCLDRFLRTNTDLVRGCSTRHGAAEQLTIVTQFLDLSQVYGSSDDEVANLRAGRGGRLIVQRRNNHEWPPITKEMFGVCNGTANVCYKAGDIRANQNPELTVLQIQLLREHNRVAAVLKKLNSHWCNEKLFQETRRILIAMYQSISYNEWLPILLGPEHCYNHKLIYKTKGYVNDYNASEDPSILNEFASAAFRSLHTLIAGNLQFFNENRHSTSSIKLSDHFNNPTIVEKGKNYDNLARGLCTQAQLAADKYNNKEITLFLRKEKRNVGNDLRAFDIQRGRDHGVETYNEYRFYCGLRKATKWNDFLDLISPEDVKKLAQLYETPDDVDLAVGAVLEAIIPGSLVGPTYHCILTQQFLKSRISDRFWFENGNNGAAFTLKQLNEIRKASISRLICDNGNDIKSMQLRGFEQISEENPLVKCEDIPSINLSLWKESAPQMEKKETRKD